MKLNTIARTAGTLALFALIAALVASCSSAGDGIDSAASPILNGTVWSPYGQATETWSRNVVRLNINGGGCTGTLLRPNWVITAGHCAPPGTALATITVSHTDSDGGTTSRGVVEIARHPDEVNGTDVILLRIDPPIDTGVASVPIFAGDTDALVGNNVRCFGYGAIAVGAACGTGLPACPSGTFCQYGNCLTPDNASLRTAVFSVIADPVDANRWYRFSVPNAAGQMELPGDSGSSCTFNGEITGVDKAGNNSNYNRQTSAEAFRTWVESVVSPALVSEDNSSGASCRGIAASLSYATTGAASNTGASTLSVVCRAPRRTDAAGNFSNVVAAPRVWVADRSSAGSVCCQMVATDSNGSVVVGPQRCSTGSTGVPESLDVAELPYAFTYASYSLQCSLPATTATGASSVLGYRILQSRR